MLSHSGIIANNWWAPSRKPLFPLFQCCFFSPTYLAFPSSSTAPFIDEDCRNFLQWLEGKAGQSISTALAVGKTSAHGRILYTTRIVNPGEMLLKVPFSVHLSHENLPLPIWFAVRSGVSPTAKLALVILMERKRGRNSDWAPYISRLLPPHKMHCTIFWNDEELKMIQPSCLCEVSRKQKQVVIKDYCAVKFVLDRFPDVFRGSTLGDFAHAYGVVKARALKSESGVLYLIPFLDFLNHSGSSEAPTVLIDETNKQSCLTALHSYDADQEVLISYGRVSNAALMLNYGFTLPNNAHDFACVMFTIPLHDPLYIRKTNILIKQCSAKPKKGEGDRFRRCFSWNRFKLKLVSVDDNNIHGKGIPVYLRAFFRVVICNSLQQLKEVHESEDNNGVVGRTPLKNSKKEAAAHQLLIDELEKLIVAHNRHIQMLVDTTPSSRCYKTAARMKLAQQLLQSEVRVMQSAIDWLEGYCFMLSLLT